MFKFAPIFLIFFLSSCFEAPKSSSQSSGSNQVGGVLKFSPEPLNADDNLRIKTICDALTVKTNQLQALENTLHTFSYSEKPCLETELSTAKNINVSIQVDNGEYRFKEVNTGNSFTFSNIETRTSGAMRDICDNVGSLQSPMITNNSGTIWFTSFVSQSECKSDADYTCIQIQKGRLVDGINYTEISREIIKFKVKPERLGFFVYRKLISNLSCVGGASFVKIANLK